MQKNTQKSGSHKEVCLWYVGLLRCKQIIIADRKSAGDCFILFDKLEFVELKDTFVIFNHSLKTQNKSYNNTNN